MTEAATVELDAQYRAMREQAALVDRPGFTAIAVSGPEAADYLQGQLTNDVEAMAPGEGRYAALLDRKGHLQGDLRVLLLGDGDYLLLAEAGPGPRCSATSPPTRSGARSRSTTAAKGWR